MHGFVASSACVSPSHIALFIAHLHHKQCSPKSISTYLSAVAFVHKLKNDCDPTQSFLVRKLVAGCYRVNPSVDMRLPVTVEVLDKIINSLSHVSSTVFEAVLFRAMFLFAFNAFARVGELAMTNTSTNLIQFENLSFASEVDQPAVHVVFSDFKHNVQRKRHAISFSHGPSSYSAVKALEDYIQYRGNGKGPVFLMLNMKPVPRSYFDRILRSCLSFAGLDSSVYKGHSFRIGAATYWSQQGMSDSQIRSCGRWSSNAFKKYIRSSTS